MWRLDKTGADFSRWASLTGTEQDNWDTFQNAIENEGVHPKQAAERIGKADYKCLAGDQYQIRLSRNNRATFRVLPDAGGGTVRVLQVGGHT